MIRQDHRATCPGNILALGVLVGFCCSVLPAIAQVERQRHALHVELVVERPDGQPEGYLTFKEFVATQDGQVLPLTVIRPVLGNKIPTGRHVPTRMLVILAPPTPSSGDTFPGLLAALKPVWQRGWHVAAARSDGNATDYVSSAAELQQAWAAPQKSSLSAETAVENLSSFMGRRIVMYLTGFPKEAMPPPKWVSERAAEAMAETFVIDGGVANPPIALPTVTAPTKEERAAMDANVYTADGRSPSTPMEGWGRTREFESGQYHEVNTTRAVQDAIHGALGYYDLRIKYPPTVPIRSDVMLSIEIKKPPPLLITAQVYGKANVPQLKVTTKQK